MVLIFLRNISCITQFPMKKPYIVALITLFIDTLPGKERGNDYFKKKDEEI